MTTNWIKEFEQTFGPMFEDLGDGQLDYANERIKDFIQSKISLAEERSDKRWRETPPEIKTELPFSVTINGVPHILTSISEQNFASLLRVGGEIDGKITLTFTRSDLLK